MLSFIGGSHRHTPHFYSVNFLNGLIATSTFTFVRSEVQPIYKVKVTEERFDGSNRLPRLQYFLGVHRKAFESIAVLVVEMNRHPT